jgi:hypothetical protein
VSSLVSFATPVKRLWQRKIDEKTKFFSPVELSGDFWQIIADER